MAGDLPTRCPARYERPGGREPGDRIVACHLQAGHSGEHEEADTEVTWVDDVGRCGDRMPGLFASTPPVNCALLAGHAGWHRGDDGAEWVHADEPLPERSDLPEGQQPKHPNAMERHELVAEVERLRTRVHEAVDECQRRHAPYVSRCDSFDAWSNWARDRFKEQGSDYWSMTSEANRLVIMSIIEERDAALAEVARVRADVAEEIARAIEATCECAREPDPEIATACEFRVSARIARRHAVAPAESVVGAPTDLVGNEEHRKLPARPMFPQDEWDPQCACGGEWPYRYQASGLMHPFTCRGEHPEGRPALIAQHDGWLCPDPRCGVSQDWAHAWMAEAADEGTRQHQCANCEGVDPQTCPYAAEGVINVEE